MVMQVGSLNYGSTTDIPGISTKFMFSVNNLPCSPIYRTQTPSPYEPGKSVFDSICNVPLASIEQRSFTSLQKSAISSVLSAGHLRQKLHGRSLCSDEYFIVAET